MPQTVADVHTEARALLNDSPADIFTDVVLLPFTKKAYQEVQDELALNGLTEVYEGDYTVDVSAGTKIVAIPSDFIQAIELYEKGLLRPDNEYILMNEGVFDPSTVQGQILGQWYYAENEIKVPGATAARTVKMKYVKFLSALVSTVSSIPVINSSAYIAARVAAIAAFSIGGNAERGKIHQMDANVRMEKLIATAVRRSQSQGTSRQPYRRPS